jgi:hypothetical protein
MRKTKSMKVYYNDGEFIEKVDFKGNILDVDDYLNSTRSSCWNPLALAGGGMQEC